MVVWGLLLPAQAADTLQVSQEHLQVLSRVVSLLANPTDTVLVRVCAWEGPLPPFPQLQEGLSQLYSCASKANVLVDVRVLLPGLSPALYRNPDLQAVVNFDPHMKLEEAVNRRRLEVGLPADVVGVELQAGEGTAYCVKYVEELQRAAEGVVEGEIPWKATYRDVILGGTFDHLHGGHKIMMTAATMATSDKMTIGITDGAMNESKAHAELIQPLETRAQVLVSLVGHLCPAVSVRWVPLYEPYGPTIKSNAYDALILSQETLRGGERINQVREENGFQPLDLIVVDCVPDPQDSGTKMSSTAIRKLLSASTPPPSP